MTVFLAAWVFGLLRGIAAGYLGPAFFTANAVEAFMQAWPLLALAVVEALLGRLAVSAGSGVVNAALGLARYALLFALFGKEWLEAHTWASEWLRIDAGPSAALIVVGLAVGACVGSAERRLSPLVGPAAAIAVSGWLVLGPDLYAWFDHVATGRRAAAAAGVSVAFAAIGLLVVQGGRRLGQARLAGVLLGLGALVVAVARFGPGPLALAGGDSIVLVVVDTLRADMLDAQNATGDALMPRVRALAHEGTSFTQAVAPSPWTLPSTMTLLSGLDPHRHLAGRMEGDTPMPGDPAASFIGTVLRERGYLVAAFVNNPYLRPYYGIGGRGRGFQRFRRYRGDAHDGVTHALRWLDLHGRRPFFLMLHLMDPHWPYQAPAAFDEGRIACAPCDDLRVLQYGTTDAAVREEVRRRYQAEVRFTDDQIGRLYDALDAGPLLERPWLIVTADHGEEFWEHGSFLHGHTLYDELLRVPLIVVPPSSAVATARDRREGAQVRLADVGATILEIAGVPERSLFGLDGLSLRRLLESRADVRRRPAVAGYVRATDSRAWGVRSATRKLIVDEDASPARLFDLASDPGETRDVAGAEPKAVAELEVIPVRLGLRVGGAATTGAAVSEDTRVDADLSRELRALGYLE